MRATSRQKSIGLSSAATLGTHVHFKAGSVDYIVGHRNGAQMSAKAQNHPLTGLEIALTNTLARCTEPMGMRLRTDALEDNA